MAGPDKNALRESIPVDSIVVDEALATNVDENNTDNNDSGDNEPEDNKQVAAQQDEPEVTDDNENEDEENEENNLTDDKPKEEVVSKATFDRRVGKLTAKSKELERSIAERDAEIARLRASSEKRDLTPEEQERQIELMAEQRAAALKFNSDCNSLADNAEKEEKGFSKRLAEIVDDVGPLPRTLIDASLNLDNGASVLNYFTKNPDEYERIFKMSPIKQIQETTKISERLKAQKAKPLSKVPAPVKSITGGAKAVNSTPAPTDNDSDEDWFRKRNATRRAPVYR